MITHSTHKAGCSFTTRAFLLSVLLVLLTAGATGCAYYNTFYNVKKKFKEAESEYRQRQGTEADQDPRRRETPQRQGAQRPGQGTGAAADKYRKVIETGSKLIEFYPKSRWIDDALLLMGISYFRMSDFSRAERKFTELVSLYPESEHVPQALLWKSRSLIEQQRFDEAVEQLQSAISILRKAHDQAELELQLGRIFASKKEWVSAAERYEQVLTLSPDGTQKAEALYQLGQCRYELQDYAAAGNAYAKSADLQKEPALAFRSLLNSARCDIKLAEYENAKRTLLRLKGTRSFSQYGPEIDMELADLAVNTGHTEEGIAMLNDLIEREPRGERRGKAFYQLALVHRDRLSDLTTAKALLDSTISAGAQRDLTDSARAAAAQIARGIDVLGKITQYGDSIRSLDERIAATPESPVIREEVMDQEQPISSPVETLPDDSGSIGGNDEIDSIQVDSSIEQALTPSQAAVDSILKALVVADTTHSPDLMADTAAPILVDTLAADSSTKTTPPQAEAPQANLRQALADQRLSVQRKLQLSYLRAGEFYRISLNNPDSAVYYYALAAAAPVDAEVYWKANLYLGRAFAAGDSSNRSQSGDYYRAILDADSVPFQALNEARAGLGMDALDTADNHQHQLFLAAEDALINETYPIDSSIAWYKETVRLDSSSDIAQRSLFALFYIYDGQYSVPRIPDSSRVYGESLVELLQNAPEVTDIKKMLIPDDSSSVFLMTEDELMKMYRPAQVTIEETQDETGWPPPEESLRGRRYQ